MTWLRRLYQNPEFLFMFVTEFCECYLRSYKQFVSCPAEFSIFEYLGLHHRIECSGDCMSCVLDFLTNPKTYEFTFRGEVCDG